MRVFYEQGPLKSKSAAPSRWTFPSSQLARYEISGEIDDSTDRSAPWKEEHANLGRGCADRYCC